MLTVPTMRYHLSLHDALPIFEAARLVVDAGVDDAAVAPGLVPRQRWLLLQHRHGDARKPLRHLHRRRQPHEAAADHRQDRKSTRLNSSHLVISYAVCCLKEKT